MHLTPLFRDTPKVNYISVITFLPIFQYTPVRAELDKCMFLLKRKRKQGLVKHNYRGIPTHVCPCGSQIIKVACIFEDGEIVLWFTEAECGMCGALLTAPTPLDMIRS